MSSQIKQASALFTPTGTPSSHAAQPVRPEPLDALGCATISSELMSALAHDAKQPLSAIGAEAAACSNWLAEDPTDLARVLASLRAMADDARRASELIDRARALLAPPLSFAACEIDALIEDAIAPLRGQLHARGLALTSALGTPGCRVRADAEQLQQVLSCLLWIASDACEAAPTGRRVVSVSTRLQRRDRDAQINLWIAHDGHVAHDALGLMQLSASTTSSSTLSLALCRSIVERHAGRLHVSPAAESGGGLGVTLPLASR